VCDGFGIARDEDGILDESSAIGLTLIPLDEYSEGDGYYEDIKFILYPDDTLFAQFDNPSAAMIELDFKQGPADLYQMLHEAVNASASDAARTRYLRRLRIQDGEYPELGKDYPLKRNISKYIYGKLRIDEDARYRVEVNGVVHTADPSGNPADIVSSNIRTSLTGYIVAIDMSPEADDPDTLRPRLFMAVQAPESEGDWYGIIVPVDSIATPIRNMRSKRSPFGKRAVLAFDSFESVEEFFYDVAGAGGKSDEDGEKDREQTVFEGILKGLDYVWHDTVAYNTEKNCFEVSLHGDVAEILQDFTEFVGKTTGLDVAPTSTDYKSVLDQMHEKTKPKLRMKQGDVIRITGGVKLQMNDGSIVLLLFFG
jgi:hypothetical protein